MLWVKRGPSWLPVPGRDPDHVDAFRAEVEEQDFQEAGAEEGTKVVKRGL